MKHIRYLPSAIGFVFAISVGLVSAQAQKSVDCTVVLLQRDIQLANSNDTSKVVYLNSIDKEQFYRLKEGAGADVPGYFSGDWNKFKEERSKINELTEYRATIEQSRSALTIMSLPEATKVWSECIRVNSQTSQFASELSGDPKGTKFHLSVSWTPGPDIAAESLVIVKSNFPELPKGSKIAPGETGYDIERSRPDDVLSYSVTGSPGKFNRTIWIYVPAFIPELPNIFPYFLGLKDQIQCISRGDKDSCFQTNPIGGSTNTIFTPPDTNKESSATFNIPRGAAYFKARRGTFGCRGEATVYIKIGESVVWPSPFPHGRSNWPSTDQVRIPIPANAKTITLAANPDGTNLCDDIAWLDAMFLGEKK